MEQNNGKEMYKMIAARANLLLIFFANEIYWFCCRRHCRRRLAQLHVIIKCLQVSRVWASLLALAKSIC